MTTAWMLLAVLATPTLQDTWPRTKAEITDYAQTSSNQDVLEFLSGLNRPGVPLRFTTIGVSGKGNRIPMVIAHENPWISPEQARAQGKLVVYVQANIHAGEVEGKECVLHLMRDFAQGKHKDWLRQMVLLVVPNYNPDGNDAWGPNKTNRGHQDGPEPVGRRENGSGFDLNRDCIKAVTPEFASVLEHIYGAWDPHVIFDLHTTNGTRHGYLHTYSPGLNPNGNAKLGAYVQDGLLAKVRKTVESRTDFKMQDYGNAEKRDGKDVWATFGWEARYVTNYASLRNRVGILSEAASFYPFKDRVRSTTVYVSTCLDQLLRDKSTVLRLTREADEVMARSESVMPRPQLGVEFAMKSRGVEKVILEDEPDASKINPMKAPTRFKTVEMPIFDRFMITRSVDVPDAYVVPLSAESTLQLLKRHGIRMMRTELDSRFQIERAKVTQFSQARNPFQGVRLMTMRVAWSVSPQPWSGEYVVVKTSQPLGMLAATILDPESVDGAYSWGKFKESYAVGDSLEIGRILLLKKRG